MDQSLELERLPTSFLPCCPADKSQSPYLRTLLTSPVMTADWDLQSFLLYRRGHFDVAFCPVRRCLGVQCPHPSGGHLHQGLPEHLCPSLLPWQCSKASCRGPKIQVWVRPGEGEVSCQYNNLLASPWL